MLSDTNVITLTDCTKCGRKGVEKYASQGGKWCKKCTRIENEKWRAQNRETLYNYERRVALKRNYGISVEDYEALLSIQNGVCAICKGSCKTGKALAVDHCHSSGVIRGLLCKECNVGLRMIEKKDFVKSAMKYLEATNA